MAKVIWAEIAIDDLKLVHDYISQDSQVYADRFTEKLISRVDQFAKFSKSGRVFRNLILTLLRELIEGSYRIVYKINSDHIGIVRVHHSAKQLKGF